MIIFFSEPRRKHYILYGVMFSLIYFFGELLVLATVKDFPDESLGLLVINEIFTIFSIVMYVAAGMMVLRDLGSRSLPLIRRLVSNKDRHYTWSVPVYVLVALGSVALCVGFSVVLFKLTNPSASSYILERLGPGDIPEPGKMEFSAVLSVTIIAMVEEIFFRHGIQNFLARVFRFRHGYLAAIVITSAAWTFGHYISMEPVWVKMVQIFPIGLLLGFLYRKYGLEMSILVHAGFNFTLSFFSAYLISY